LFKHKTELRDFKRPAADLDRIQKGQSPKKAQSAAQKKHHPEALIFFDLKLFFSESLSCGFKFFGRRSF